MKRVLTTFKISKEFKNNLFKQGVVSIPFSRWIENEVERFLDSGELVQELTPETLQQKNDRVYTSVTLPIELRDRAKIFAVKSHISLGALVRYILNKHSPL